MRILNWYITKNYLATFLMAILVLTFVLTGAQLMKLFDYISRGIPISVAINALLYTIPQALSFTLPWASLVAVMLVFGRMSADNEITAMRASGISILQIVSPLIVLSFLFTCLCLYLQLQVAPQALIKARTLVQDVVVKHPISLFTPGVPVQLRQFANNTSLYIDAKDAENNIYNIQIYVLDDDGRTIRQDMSAARGKIEINEENHTLKVILYDALISTKEGGEMGGNIHLASRETAFVLDYGTQFNESDVSLRAKFLPLKDLLARTMIAKTQGVDQTALEVELNQRIALALAPIAFLLLGLPLAIRTSRRETSVGLFLSVILAGVYFCVVPISDALNEKANLYPQYIVWIPVILYQAFGAYYMIRIARK